MGNVSRNAFDVFIILAEALPAPTAAVAALQTLYQVKTKRDDVS